MRVTNFGWSVSSTTGTDIKGAVLNVYKHRGVKVVNGNQMCRCQNGELNGKRFASSDEAHAAAEAHGYTVRATNRPTSFIHLRLHGRLKGWLHNAKEAVEELGSKEAAQWFKSNLQIGNGDITKLLN